MTALQKSFVPIAQYHIIPGDLFRVVIRLFRVVEDVGKVAATAVLTVVHGSHEDTSTALEDAR